MVGDDEEFLQIWVVSGCLQNAINVLDIPVNSLSCLESLLIVHNLSSFYLVLNVCVHFEHLEHDLHNGHVILFGPTFNHVSILLLGVNHGGGATELVELVVVDGLLRLLYQLIQIVYMDVDVAQEFVLFKEGQHLAIYFNYWALGKLLFKVSATLLCSLKVLFAHLNSLTLLFEE